jgi:hypothetical protein
VLLIDPIKLDQFLLKPELLTTDASLHSSLERGLGGVFLTLHAIFGQSYARAVSLPIERVIAMFTLLLDLDPFSYRLSVG